MSIKVTGWSEKLWPLSTQSITQRVSNHTTPFMTTAVWPAQAAQVVVGRWKSLQITCKAAKSLRNVLIRKVTVCLVSDCHVLNEMFLLESVQSFFVFFSNHEPVATAHTAIECPAPQPMRRGLRPDMSWGWKTSVCEPSPHIPCSFQPQERRQPPEKKRGHGSVELGAERQDCSTALWRLKLAAWRKKHKKGCEKRKKKNTRTHTRMHKHTHGVCSHHWHTASEPPPSSLQPPPLPCHSLLVSLLVGVVRSASPRRHVPWQHSYLIGSIAMATEASLPSQG